MATVLSILASLASFAGKFFGWLSSRQLIDAGKAEANLDARTKQDKANAKANAARDGVRVDALKHPAGGMSDDGFRRD